MKERRKLEKQQVEVSSEVRKIVAEPENLVPFLVPGRLLRISVTNDSTDGSE